MMTTRKRRLAIIRRLRLRLRRGVGWWWGVRWSGGALRRGGWRSWAPGRGALVVPQPSHLKGRGRGGVGVLDRGGGGIG